MAHEADKDLALRFVTTECRLQPRHAQIARLVRLAFVASTRALHWLLDRLNALELHSIVPLGGHYNTCAATQAVRYHCHATPKQQAKQRTQQCCKTGLSSCQWVANSVSECAPLM